MRTSKVLKFIGFGLLGLGAIGLFVFITMLLWNWLVPLLFHGPVVTYWQAAGLIVLSKIIFSGFGHGGGGHDRRRHANMGECDHRPNRVDWWKRFNEMKKGNSNPPTVE
ncbi:MAG TPA: hypothetical protein VFC67_24405 [Prolixibacteraceae bacterium]|nr:hypothetical protein [Prolixibacteraceae bacterium]